MFRTQRLDLRELYDSDLDNMHWLQSMPEVDEFNTLGIPESIETTREILEETLAQKSTMPRMSYTLAIELDDTPEFIGLIALNLGNPKYKAGEVWYKIAPKYWRQGYSTEALQRLLLFAFQDLKLHRVEAGCAIENIASIRVLEKVGMTREGHKRKALPIRGAWVDNYEYAILDEDHRALYGAEENQG